MGSDAQPLLTLQGLTQMSQLTEYKIKSSQQIGNDLRLVVDCTPRS
jgi:riboflavin biosynthesis pyrimidine reductase